MVSSELVVLLIVCVGINTGSAQEYCQDGPYDIRVCTYLDSIDSINTDCMDTTLQCEGNGCQARLNNKLRHCNMGISTRLDTAIRCCFCNGSTLGLWWYCSNATSISPSQVHTDTSSIVTMVTSINDIMTISTTGTIGTSNQVTMTTTPVTSTKATTISSTMVTTPTFTMTTVTMTTTPPVTSTSVITITSTMVTTPTFTMTTVTMTTAPVTSVTTTYPTIATIPTTANPSTITAVIVSVVVVVLVVCLLVVCAIATIIILYQRAKHYHDTSYQTTLHQLDNKLYNTNVVTYDYPNISMITPAKQHMYYEIPVTHNGRNTQQAPPIYSTVIKDETRLACQYNTTAENPVYRSTMTEAATPGEYSTTAVNPLYCSTMADKKAPAPAEYRQDGKKTSVKVTVE